MIINGKKGTVVVNVVIIPAKHVKTFQEPVIVAAIRKALPQERYFTRFVLEFVRRFLFVLKCQQPLRVYQLDRWEFVMVSQIKQLVYLCSK